MMEEETYKASVEVDTPGTAGNSDHEPLRVCLGAHQFYLAPRPPKGDAPEGQQPRTVLKQPINTAEMNIAKDRIRHTHWRKAAQLQSLILESRALAEAALAEWEGGPLDTRVTSILKEGLARRGITAALVDEASAILQEYVVAAYGTLLETCETRTVGRPGGTRPTRKQCRNLDAARQLHRMAKIPYGVLHNLRSNKGGAHPTLEEFTDVLTAHPLYEEALMVGLMPTDEGTPTGCLADLFKHFHKHRCRAMHGLRKIRHDTYRAENKRRLKQLRSLYAKNPKLGRKLIFDGNDAPTSDRPGGDAASRHAQSGNYLCWYYGRIPRVL